MTTLTYPHTTNLSTLKSLRSRLVSIGQTELADMAGSALDMYRQKKEFYTRRIAELEAGQKQTSLVYPHTTLQDTLPSLAMRLKTIGQTELAAMATSALQMYMQKKSYYTARINELKAAPVQADTVQAASSVVVPDSFATAFSDAEDESEDDDEENDNDDFNYAEDVRSMDGYPHTNVLESIMRLRQQLAHSTSSAEALELLANIERDYNTKKEWYVRTIQNLKS